MENKFQEGDFVYAKTDPTLKLVVRRYLKRIYYCKMREYPNGRDLVYFEKDLVADKEYFVG